MAFTPGSDGFLLTLEGVLLRGSLGTGDSIVQILMRFQGLGVGGMSVTQGRNFKAA